MRLKNQDELLNDDVRKQIIVEIEGAENQRRRAKAYKWHEIWKDRIKDFVRENLSRFLDDSTVVEMEYSITNISIVRKIIDKLAKVYSQGVERTYEDKTDTENLADLEKLLKANINMKTFNKILKLQRNAALYIKPVQSVDEDGEMKSNPAWIPLAPYLYDVIEETDDRTKPIAFILSNFERAHFTGGQQVPELAAHHRIGETAAMPGNNIDEKIADNKEDENTSDSKTVYIWWTSKYHFTTVGSEIVDPTTMQPFALGEDEALLEKILNPIERLPFVDAHIDQDGHYWAEGGDDLIDGALLINTLITNANHIGITQGYGQLVVSGVNTVSYKLGPNKVLVLPPQEQDGGKLATADFITANPPLDDLAMQAEVQTALLLTTNNLSTAGLASSLKGSIQGGRSEPSGIALAIDRSESLEDVKDQRDIFKCVEIEAWEITAAWMQVFKEDNIISEKFAEITIPAEAPTVAFKDPKMIMSESDTLENIGKRRDLGLNTQIELIMKDRDITEPEAIVIMAKIDEDKRKRMAAMNGGDDESDKDESDKSGDLLGNQSGNTGGSDDKDKQ